MTAASTAASPEVASREVSLELIGLSRRFGSVVALDGLTFSVPPARSSASWGRTGRARPPRCAPSSASSPWRPAGSLVSRQSDIGTVILPVQIPLIVAYALSYTVIYANGANLFYKVLGFFPPTAPVAMPVLYAAVTCPRRSRLGCPAAQPHELHTAQPPNLQWPGG